MSASTYMSEKLFSVEDVVLHTLAFLPPADLLQTALISTLFYQPSRRDFLWKQVCLSELNVTALTDLPPSCPSLATAPPAPQSFFHLYRLWRREFRGYHLADVKAVSSWWAQMEAWLHEHAPPVLATLNPPATENDFVNTNAAFLHHQVTDQEGNFTTLPYLLRLLYRFHNGQKTLFDPDEEMDMSFIQTSLLGLFGGTQFYDSQVCMRLLPLQEVMSVTAMVGSHLRGKSRSHPPCNSYSHGSHPSPEPLPTRVEDCVIFSSSIIDFQKFYCLGQDRVQDQNSSVPQSPPQCGSVFVSNAAWGLTPCHPIAVADGTHGNSGNYLLDWLQEYLRRLQEGVYIFQPPDLSIPQDRLEHLPIEERNARMISLYPQRPLYDNCDDPEHENNLGASRCVTRNIEVVACPTYIPEKSNPSTRSFFWSYSVRLRMLSPDDPGYVSSGGSGMTSGRSCQLSTRHWEIYEPGWEDDQEGSTNIVDGEAVVGLYPLLSEDRPGRPFAYQSCSTAKCFPGSFKGHMQFIPGSRQTPMGAPFDVQLAEFSLDIPQFIY